MKLLTIAFVFITISQLSCYTIGLKKQTKVDENILVYDFFSENNTLKFRTEISLYKTELNGIMIIKETNPDTFRIVMINELGLKLFDYVQYSEGFKMLKAIPPLQKDGFFKLMADVFHQILFPPDKEEITKQYIHKKDNSKVLRRKKNFWFYDEESKIYRIEKRNSFSRVKNIYEISESDSSFMINYKRKDLIRLKMNLKQID